MVKIPKYQKDDIKKIAILQGGAWGDNINSTLMLKPIKEHFKNSILDIHTSNLYGNAFDNNPFVDHIIKHNVNSKNDAINLALSVPKLIADSNYDIISAPHPMYNPDKWTSIKHPEWGTNLILAWVRALEDMGVPCDNLETTLKLTDTEISNAKRLLNSIQNDNKNILMEIHGESGQTQWSPEWTKRVGEYLCDNSFNLLISHKDKRGDIEYLKNKFGKQVYWVGGLSIRECAEIFNNCHAFFSVSSGLSNACNTSWCKNDIKWIETVNSKTCSSSVIREHGKVFNHESNLDSFINMLKVII